MIFVRVLIAIAEFRSKFGKFRIGSEVTSSSSLTTGESRFGSSPPAAAEAAYFGIFSQWKRVVVPARIEGDHPEYCVVIVILGHVILVHY